MQSANAIAQPSQASDPPRQPAQGRDAGASAESSEASDPPRQPAQGRDAGANAESSEASDPPRQPAQGRDAGANAESSEASDPPRQPAQRCVGSDLVFNQRQRSVVLKHVVAKLDKNTKIPYASLGSMAIFRSFSMRRLKVLITNEIRIVQEQRERAEKTKRLREQQMADAFSKRLKSELASVTRGVEASIEAKIDAIVESKLESKLESQRTDEVSRLQADLSRALHEAEESRNAISAARNEERRLREALAQAEKSAEELREKVPASQELTSDQDDESLRQAYANAQAEALELREKLAVTERLQEDTRRAAEEAQRLRQVCEKSDAEVKELRAKLLVAEKAEREAKQAAVKQAQAAIDEHLKRLSNRFKLQSEQMQAEFAEAKARLGSNASYEEYGRARAALDEKKTEYERKEAEAVAHLEQCQQWYRQQLHAMHVEKEGWKDVAERLKQVEREAEMNREVAESFTMGTLVENVIRRTVRTILSTKSSTFSDSQLRGMDMKELRDTVVQEYEVFARQVWQTDQFDPRTPWKTLEHLMRTWWQTRNAVHHEMGVVNDVRHKNYQWLMKVIISTLEDFEKAIRGSTVEISRGFPALFEMYGSIKNVPLMGGI